MNKNRLYPFHMTLQLRLTLWYTALLGVTLVLFSLLVFYFLNANLYTKVRSDALEQAPIVAQFAQQQLVASSSFSSVVPSSRGPGDYSVILQFIEIPNINVFVGIGDVQFFNVDTGEVPRNARKLFPDPVPIQPEALAAVKQGQAHYDPRFVYKNTPLSAYSFAMEIDGEIVGVQILQSILPVDNILAQTRRLLTFGTILSLVLAALVGAYLARRTLRPLKTITETASGITQTDDLGQRLVVPEQTSEVGVLGKTFNQMLDRIQQLFKTQERLIADVSHELRTPLTTIQGNVDLMQRFVGKRIQSHSTDPNPYPKGGTSQEEDEQLALFSEMLAEVEDETNRMGRMISDLLLLAQADSGELTIQKEPVEVDTLLLDIFRQTQRLAERAKGVNGLTIQLGSEDQALVLGDKDRLRQLLLNLTGNAIKYTPIGGQIMLGLEVVNGWVKVSVQDTGIGISEENQALIFERFYRTDKARSREIGGSGLGLSISQWIAWAHGGKITVESQLQVGSTFTLWLPSLEKSSG